jgi:hypothetical protein
VFTKHHVADTELPDIPVPKVALVKPATSPRAVSVNPHSKKAQEPTAEEWKAAAEYNITLSLPKGWEGHDNQTTELVLAIDYAGDAARVYFKDRLLTDNWFSGYVSEGAMEVGLTYLSEENPGLLEDGAVLTLLILPLKKSTLDGTALKGEGSVFLQKSFWPDFGGNASVLRLNELRWVATAHIPLAV